ncbi:DUF2939 domain-containing protein [Kaistia sp. UC242_56]|uniref:DUF2939 domain-containing protein n=1 Tax=Kaistia sp. UC242_56 TaxID=3374625 RepID=UPI00379F439F
MKKMIVVGAVAAALLYVASPYFAIWSIYHSATTGDALALDEKIDWLTVRAGLKEQLGAAMVAGAVKNAKEDQFAAGLMALAGPVVIDRAIDTYVNSQNLVQLIRDDEKRRAERRKIAAPTINIKVEDQTLANDHFPQKDLSLNTDSITYAFFTSPTRFRLSIGDKDKGVLNVLMRFSPGGWEVYRIGLPDELMKEFGSK